MRIKRFNDGLTRAPERVTMGLIALVIGTNLVACESGDTNPVACYVKNDDGSQTPFYLADYASEDEAEAACEEAAAAQGDADTDTDSDTDADTDSDTDNTVTEDPETGAETKWIGIRGVVMTWVTGDGARVCLDKSRVDWDVNPDDAFTVGYGWGGSADWSTLIHSADQYRYDGTLYVCPVSALSPNDTVYVQNFTRLGNVEGPEDNTNWGEVNEGDLFAFMTERTAGAPAFALCYSVVESDDEDIGFDVYQSTSGSCEYAVGLY